MMSSLILCNKTQVALNDRRYRLLNSPFANVAESLPTDGSLLSSL